MAIIKSTETSIATIKLIEDQIVQINFKDHVEIEAEHLIELRRITLEWTEGRGYCTYVESGAFNSYSKELRDIMSKPENSKGRIAVAVLQSNLAVRLIVDFFWKVTGNKKPTRLFSSKEECVNWLKEKRDEDNALQKQKSNIA